MKRVLCAILVLVSYGAVAAPTDEKKAEKLAYELDLAKTKKDQPQEFAKFKRVFTFSAELLLARLGYDVAPFDGVLDEKTQKALKSYEKARGLPITGDPLAFETVEQVASDTAVLDDSPTVLPRRHVFLDLWDDGFVEAQGTWVMQGEEMAWPEQTSKISCDASAATCVEATAIVSKSEGLGPSLMVDVDTYEIERWDEFEIVTKPLQLGCTRYVRRISRPQESVSGIRSTTSSTDSCRGLDNADKLLVLEDGGEIWQRLSDHRSQMWRELVVLNHEILELLQQ